MGYRRQLFGVTAWGVAGAVALTSAVAAPPPIPSAYPTTTPPGRVGRLARLTGAVSFHTADADHWDPAALNYPVTSGDAFWTEPRAHADIGFAASRIAMDSSTEFDVTTLDDHTLAAAEPQGGVYLHLVNVPGGDATSIQTPRGSVQFTGDGRYEVVAGGTDHPTTVTVLEGAAEITGVNLSLQVGPQQTATITGTDSFQGFVGPLARDAFLTAMLAEERPAPRRSVALVPPVVQRMTGADDLDQYGAWQATPQYGSVWVPQVQSGYVPYRNGRWSYVAPWGWTWIDAAPWGFAPFHYGRWVQLDSRWCWAPAVAEQPVEAYPEPVYAPALVSFVDLGAAAAVGAAIGYAAGAYASRNVGWVPLGPGEPYYPPYNRDPAYVRRVNVTNIRNVNQVITNTTVNNITNNQTVVQNFVNRSAATVVPVAAMVQSRPVAAAVQPISFEQLSQLRPQPGAPVRPTLATPGITPSVAQALRLPAAAPGQSGPAVARPAPGPEFARPALRPEAATRPLALRPADVTGRSAAEPPHVAAPNQPEPLHPAGASPPPNRPAPPAPLPAIEAVRPPPTPLPQQPHVAAPPPREAFQPPQPIAPPPRPAAPPPRPAAPPPRPAVEAPPHYAPPPPRPEAAPQPHFASPPPRPAAPPPQPAPPPRPAAPHPAHPGEPPR